jgi:putative hydrolase of the HAD superfamily
MIRVLLVDAGGVLFNNITEETDFVRGLASRHDVDPSILRREIDRRNSDYEADARHVYDVLGECLAQAGAKKPIIDRIWTDELYLACVRDNRIVFDWLQELHESGSCPVLALANNEAWHFDQLKNGRFGHFGLFDVIGSSWQLRAVKPSSEYFDRLLDACACSPHEALLVDDRPEVVAAASALGMLAMHVTDPSAIPAEFRSLRADLFPGCS